MSKKSQRYYYFKREDGACYLYIKKLFDESYTKYKVCLNGYSLALKGSDHTFTVCKRMGITGIVVKDDENKTFEEILRPELKAWARDRKKIEEKYS